MTTSLARFGLAHAVVARLRAKSRLAPGTVQRALAAAARASAESKRRRDKFEQTLLDIFRAFKNGQTRGNALDTAAATVRVFVEESSYGAIKPQRDRDELLLAMGGALYLCFEAKSEDEFRAIFAHEWHW